MALKTNSLPRAARHARVLSCALLALFSAVACTPPAEAPDRKQLGPDVFMSGQDVRLRAPTDGDAFIAGGSVALDAPVDHDAVLAGGNVGLQAPVGGDLYAAGREIQLNSKVGHNARLAGEFVGVRPQAEIAGGATIVAARVALDRMLPNLHTPTKPELERAMEGYVVASAELIGTYAKGQ
jgi:hypothetical protein